MTCKKWQSDHSFLWAEGYVCCVWTRSRSFSPGSWHAAPKRVSSASHHHSSEPHVYKIIQCLPASLTPSSQKHPACLSHKLPNPVKTDEGPVSSWKINVTEKYQALQFYDFIFIMTWTAPWLAVGATLKINSSAFYLPEQQVPLLYNTQNKVAGEECNKYIQIPSVSKSKNSEECS